MELLANITFSSFSEGKLFNFFYLLELFLLTTKEYIRRGQVIERLVIPVVVVIRYPLSDALLELLRQIVELQ